MSGARRAELAIAGAGVAAGAAAFALARTSDHYPLTLAESLLGVLIGWSFIASGLVARRRRPDNRFGLLLIGVGFAAFAEALLHSDSSLLFTAGQVLELLYIGVFVHALLAFPGGRLESRLERALVAAGYVDVLLVQLVYLLFEDFGHGTPGCECPPNLLLLSDEPGLADAIEIVQGPIVGVALCAAGIAVLVRRWRGATAPLRRALAPVLLTGGVCVALIASSGVIEQFDERAADVVSNLALVALACVPLAFLAGLLRTRLARSAVGELVVELRQTPPPGKLADALRRALGDPSLSLAYWLPDSRSYVDAEGRPVELPEKGAQATTLVEHGGRRVAALIHDPSLRDDPALVDAVCAAAGLALENERLQAELRARLDDLRASRARLVEAGDSERRRLERNLHDGAQQRLVSLSLAFRLAQSKLDSDPESAKEILARAGDDLSQALAELRELARGIHPAVLTDRGLTPALEALADRAPMPVEVQSSLERRLPEPVEAAAYYVVSEALANVVKYANALSVTVELARRDGTAVVEIRDDGVGGADPERGSGLRGLADRVEVLDGRLSVESRPGGGTRVRAEIPCA